jgi:predicted phosphodiesterase
VRWAVVSDIHGNLPALEAVIAHAQAQAGGVDGWLNLGDIASGPLWPRETVARLMALDWPTIAGNHERQLLTHATGASDAFAAARLSDAQKRWLAALPATLALDHGLAAVHGAPGDDLQYLLETSTPQGLRAATAGEIDARLGGLRAALLVCGHSHVPRDVAHGGTRLVNPGSVGLPAYDHDEPFEHVVENGTPQARYALVEHTAVGWQVALHAVDYDHDAAARQAEAHGRGDWADALRSGRVGRRAKDISPASRAAPG